MSYIPRSLNLEEILSKNSFFLFGPRAVGKSSLIKKQLIDATYIDLFNPKEFSIFNKRPEELEERAASLEKGSLIIVDEIQRIPELLNSVQRLIENKHMRFLLTGSSARKLRRGQANLLAGRAWQSELFPLTYKELGSRFDIVKYLNRGGLPRAYFSKDWKEELISYAGVYLKEEVAAEGLTRNLQAFGDFLEVAALQSGEELSLENIASDSGVKAKTVSNYIEILEDTLIGFKVPAFRKTKKRKAISRAKFFIFDVGLSGYLSGRGKIEESSESFGKAFEHFIFQELRAYLSYTRNQSTLSYWRSVNGQEVDMLIGNSLAIEIKSTKRVSSRHLKGLTALREEGLFEHYILISREEHMRTVDGVSIYPWRQFLDKLWENKFRL